MDFRYSDEDEEFRTEVREWLRENLAGEFAAAVGTGGPGSEHEHFEIRREWERRLGEGGWIGLDWPKEYGGREATLMQQVIFGEEYARAKAPGRVNHMGENLLGPTVLAFGTDEQKARFLPPIARGEELWCQGYSEPGAGSDLAGLRSTAVRDDETGDWLISGQKVWTSLAHEADWIFVLARTEAGSTRHKGITFFLAPMDQPGIEVRPIVQLTGTSEFNEVFFDGARARPEHVVGQLGQGWGVAMGLLAFERGVSTLAQQIGFELELQAVIDRAKDNGAIDDPILRERLLQAWIDLKVLRCNALRTLGSPDPGAPSVAKLVWGTWHQRLGTLAMDVGGVDSTLAAEFPYELTEAQRLFLFTKSDTIYGGSNEVQRNIIAERVLGMPREPKGEAK
ncbi:acyl-CoA dehydrogenase family protein [Yinghuangia seranimata]|uniref:acyl-CoA dehydrogenase family protein n=1 Tax=Yinghuangia seranimata TaxID=408067 RepID=UPI00248B84FC|nr:acyl-CoA dehydrogenase family protein [Yinghuangia seranimata]MDI2130330.1 acyl-CoA dehydrogenase family protein [Yinghuangia seranimata]